MNYNKMFVRYAGNIEAFKAAGGETTYNKSIVFIGDGEAVYTHGKYYGDVKSALAALQTTVEGLKYFSGIKAGDSDAVYTAIKDGVITFTAADPASVEVKADSLGVHIGLASAFTDKVNDTASGLAEEILRATGAEDKIKAALGEKTASAATGDEASAFGRIKNLEQVVAGLTGAGDDEVESVETQITNAINALDVEALDGDYVASISQADGKIVPVMGTFNFDAAGSAEAAQAAAKEYTDAEILKVNNAASTLEGRVKANEDAIDVLNGDGAGSVKKAVDDAINKFATDVTDDAVVNSYKELIDYAAEHGSEFTALVGEVSANKTAAETGIQEAKNAAATADEKAVAAQGTADANASRLDTIEGDYLKGADKEELQGNINTVSGVANAASEAAAANKASIEAMDLAKVEGFVTSIEQVDGKVSATAVQTIAAEKIIIADADDHFTAGVTNAEQALAALAAMWDWSYPDAQV